MKVRETYIDYIYFNDNNSGKAKFTKVCYEGYEHYKHNTIDELKKEIKDRLKLSFDDLYDIIITNIKEDVKEIL